MNDGPRGKWRNLLDTWAVDSNLADQSFEKIRQHYAEPGRFYHTLDHVQFVLQTIETLSGQARNANAVRLAGWLHDVIYESRVSDNEERSADYAERLCVKLSLPVGPLVADLIRKTKTHDAVTDADAQVLLDADLAILGASEAEYRLYAANIRREYAWVSEADYRQGRRRVLQSFLSRTRIFHFLCHREEPARRNLVAEIAQLGVP
jgi:predicted metal-dependent HD superfamily phosphohydrolase